MSEAANRRIAIVTDSTSDLPPELVREHALHVVPLTLIMGNQTWLDGVDIDPPAFYELLSTSPHFPSTSQPSVAAFEEVFTKLSKEAEGIVAVLISDDLSGTVNSARLAAENLPDIPIEIVDTRAVSIQLGLCAVAAARAAAAGGDLQTVAKAARSLVGRVHLIFMVDTLEYLHRGGRIGAASRLLGTALNLKPILSIQDGVVEPVTKVRTRGKALGTLLDLIEDQLSGGERPHMGVLHVNAPEEAARLAEQLEARFKPAEVIQTECGPVIGTHAGPGALGVAFYTE